VLRLAPYHHHSILASKTQDASGLYLCMQTYLPSDGRVSSRCSKIKSSSLALSLNTSMRALPMNSFRLSLARRSPDIAVFTSSSYSDSKTTCQPPMRNSFERSTAREGSMFRGPPGMATQHADLRSQTGSPASRKTGDLSRQHWMPLLVVLTSGHGICNQTRPRKLTTAITLDDVLELFGWKYRRC
jgi:hypothetical protein